MPFNSVFTRQRHGGHLEALGGKRGQWFCDCLHLCWTEPFWAAVFGELRRLADSGANGGEECARAREDILEP